MSENMNDSAQPPEPGDDRLYRFLKVAVIVMGVLLVVGFVVIVVGMISKISSITEASAPAGSTPYEVDVALPATSSLVDVHGQGQFVVVQAATADGHVLIILDGSTGERLGTIRLTNGE